MAMAGTAVLIVLLSAPGLVRLARIAAANAVATSENADLPPLEGETQSMGAVFASLSGSRFYPALLVVSGVGLLTLLRRGKTLALHCILISACGLLGTAIGASFIPLNERYLYPVVIL
jgi:hypothetical protein